MVEKKKFCFIIRKTHNKTCQEKQKQKKPFENKYSPCQSSIKWSQKSFENIFFPIFSLFNDFLKLVRLSNSRVVELFWFGSIKRRQYEKLKMAQSWFKCTNPFFWSDCTGSGQETC